MSGLKPSPRQQNLTFLFLRLPIFMLKARPRKPMWMSSIYVVDFKISIQNEITFTLIFVFSTSRRKLCSSRHLSAGWERHRAVHQLAAVLRHGLRPLHRHQAANHLRQEPRAHSHRNFDDQLHERDQAWDTAGKRERALHSAGCRGLWSII